jgi:hypothetical protein
MKIISATLLLLFSFCIFADIDIYGFSDDTKHFAFAYEPNDPMALSGGLKILSIEKNTLTADTLLNEFNDSYTGLKDVSTLFETQYSEILSFTGNKNYTEYPGSAENGRITLFGLKTKQISYSISKSLNEFGFYSYSTTLRIEDKPPLIFSSRITDVYSAFLIDDSICVVITKGFIVGFEGSFTEMFDCFYIPAKAEIADENKRKNEEMQFNIGKLKKAFEEFYIENANNYPNSIELFGRTGIVIRNPFKKTNDGIAITDKLPKFASKYEGTIIALVAEERNSYKLYFGKENEFEEAKEEKK